MKDIVIIPAYDRSEMLWNCLERLSACSEIFGMQVRVTVDCHQGKCNPVEEIREVIVKFPELKIVTTVMDPHSYRGNSFNVLSAYRRAVEAGAPFVFMVEDDVMVEPDFFCWHYEAQASKPFCSVGVENTRSGKLKTTEDFASLGVCFSCETLTHIIKHGVTNYFSNTGRYCQDKFGIVPGEHTEQDGLILRIMRSLGGTAIFPESPKARHIGWYGYNHADGLRPEGTLQERYDAVRKVAEGQEVPCVATTS